MIKDRIENAESYERLGPGIAKAMRFLRTTDCAKLAPGKYDIDGQQVFAVVQHYFPRPLDQVGWEAHHRYIDVQYIAAGSERMGYTPLSDDLELAKPYDPPTDLIFYTTSGDLLTFHTGDFAIFTPRDVHAPAAALASGEPVEVVKVVVKVRVDEHRGGLGF